MMTAEKAGETVWSVVYSGGDASDVDMGGLIHRWLGRPKPKEYCAFAGTRSVFQHAVDRAIKVSGWEQVMAVVPHEHARDAQSQLEGRGGCTLLTQPAYGTVMTASYQALTYIRALNPSATVVVYPSNHFVYPEHRFLHAVQRAVRATEQFPDRLVFLGISPEDLRSDCGWIRLGEPLDGSSPFTVSGVRSFLEHPTTAQADVALASGALWNTSVCAAKIAVWWEAGRQCWPTMMARFDRLSETIGTLKGIHALDAVYRDMPVRNVSTDLLRLAPQRLAVVEMAGVLWSDWNTPERITNMLRRIGRQPAFPLTCMNQPFTPRTVVGTAEVVTTTP